MNPDLFSTRAKNARLAKAIGKTQGNFLAALATILALIGLTYLIHFQEYRYGWLTLALAALATTIDLYYFKHLARLPAKPDSSRLEDQLTASVLALLPAKKQLNPRLVWLALSRHWQLTWITNHLLLSVSTTKDLISTESSELASIWQKASAITKDNKASAIEPGFVAAAILSASPKVEELFKQMKQQPEDIKATADWLARELAAMNQPRQLSGGIGRDWAFGYTPELNRYGSNISLAVAGAGAHYTYLSESESVKSIESAFNNHAGAVAIIGEPGSGKTSHIYALAQKLIQGKSGRTLAFHQIIGLNASQIISSAQDPGQLEKIILSLVNEARHAGHVILFLDDAEMFLKNDSGSFDATRILQPLVENRSVPLILALTPEDFQRLRSNNPSFAGLLTPIVLSEPSEAETMRVLEDTATGFEARHRLVVTYEALKEAYDLSGRYDYDKAYPGRAIDLLEQSLTHAIEDKIVTAASVQQAIEQARGVKVSSTTQAEASELLNLEDKIHERMINQSRAVQVVSAALRRARAGVASTSRPIGSFLFLGPTGVGKTELAKSIAATYFGDETNMIRLDMSEYQQETDVSRLLASGTSESASLILSIRQQPFSVVLLDEIEKAHPNILNLLLQLLDEGQLTDASGKPASFKDAIIIATSNAGADTIRQKIEQGIELESFEKEFTDELINNGQFKPELLNRFDEIVLFRPLKPEELNQVVRLMLAGVNQTLARQNISVELTDAAIAKIVQEGNDPRLGARPMRRAIQNLVENNIANRILAGSIQPGDKVVLDDSDLG